MDKKINLPNLKNIFNEAIERNEPTIAFNVINGKGNFLFMMFFDPDDISTKDELYIFMKNSKKMLNLKMYGNHFRGQFYIYIKPFMEEIIKVELGIENNKTGNSFNLYSFFIDINSSFPDELSLGKKIDIIRNSWEDIKSKLPKGIIEEDEKIYLIGPKKLPPNKKPKEKTLRKLYLYNEDNSSEIAKFIEHLKKTNSTVAWTSDENYKGNAVRTFY